MTDLIGITLAGDYRIERVIGRGGMAYVYSATQLSLGRLVAIKVIKNDLIEDDEFIARFDREVKVLADLEHPHIVPVIAYGKYEHQVYIVMRLIDGSNLAQRVRQSRVPLPTCGKIMTHMGSALTFAHQKGIVHRDMKPSNVMLDKNDNAYLTDFGIAKLLQSSIRLTATDTVLGTPAYMPPEQWQGEELDARTDVYAMGVMAYEMVTGKLPYEGDTSFTLMYKHFNETPQSPKQWVSDLPDALEAVILKALEKTPNNRFQSAEEFGQAFRIAAEGGTPAIPVSVASLPTRIIRRADDPDATRDIHTEISDLPPTLSNAASSQTLRTTQNSPSDAPLPQPTYRWAWGLGLLVIAFILGILGLVALNRTEETAQATATPVIITATQPALLGNNQALTFKQATVPAPYDLSFEIPFDWLEPKEMGEAITVTGGDGKNPQVVILRGDPIGVLGRSGLIRHDLIEPANPFNTLRNWAQGEEFAQGFKVTEIQEYPLRAVHLHGISVQQDNRYADYFIFLLQPGNRNGNRIPEWLVVLSWHNQDDIYIHYQQEVLPHLLQTLTIDGTLLADWQIDDDQRNNSQRGTPPSNRPPQEGQPPRPNGTQPPTP